MRIKCLDCGRSEEVTMDLFVKIIGGATAGFGFWAWVTFLFAGTGFAMAICIAIIGGGVAMLAYKDQIVGWLVKKGYECDRCGSKKWTAVSLEMEKEINAKETKIASLEKEAEMLRQNFTVQEKEMLNYINELDSFFSPNDVEELFVLLEEKDSKIEALLKDKVEWEKHEKSFLLAEEKVVVNLENKFKVCYSSLDFNNRSLKRIVRIIESERLKLEQQLGFLQHNPQNASFIDDIHGTDVREIGFSTSGRLYVRKLGSRYAVVCVGNKNSQNVDLKYLKSTYPKS